VSRVRFGTFELDLTSGELRNTGVLVRLQPQPLKVLMLLASRAGQLVSRADIRKQVWPDDTFVDFDQGLNYCIRQIRAALCDDADTPRFVETVPRRGYRFRAPIQPVTPSVPDRVMLIVLPFQNLSGDAEQEFLSDGLTEEMIAQAGRLNPQRLAVIARTSSMRYKNTDKSIDMIGRELGVSHALEGSIRRAGNRVRVTARLMDTANQTQRWSESFDRDLGDILAVQAEIAQAIAREVGVQLTPEERVRLSTPRALPSGAYEEYLKGRYFWKRRRNAALQESIEHFTRAIALEPSYASAYAGFADVHLTRLDYNHVAPREAFDLCGPLLIEALRLDDTRAEAHTSLGHLRLHQFDWEASQRQFVHAIAVNPGYEIAHYYYANLLAAFGRFDEALAEADRAVELDPLSANMRQNRAFVLYLARRYDAALHEIAATLELDPAYTGMYYDAGLVYERKSDYARALEAFRNVGPSQDRQGATVQAVIAYTLARTGDRDAALSAFREVEQIASREYVSPYEVALVHLALGHRETACALFETAYDRHASFVPFLGVDPRVDELRNDPRFLELLARLNGGTHLSYPSS
jgi:TolB-like protein/Tfp pilus assembly protein PilF